MAMTQLRTKYEEHAQQVVAAEVAALDVQQGAAELEAMREEQNALSQRIAFLQGLLQVLILYYSFVTPYSLIRGFTVLLKTCMRGNILFGKVCHVLHTLR